MTVHITRAARLFSCLALAALCSRQSLADTTEIACSLNYQAKGWSAVVAVAEGSGTVACSDGSSRAVSIRMRSIGATAGKSRVDHGAGRFTHVHSIDDVLGTYAQSEVHAGVVKSSSAQVLTKGRVSLALAGEGEGVDLGLTIGELTLTAAR